MNKKSAPGAQVVVLRSSYTIPYFGIGGNGVENLKEVRAQRLKVEYLRERIEVVRAAAELGERHIRNLPTKAAARQRLESDMIKLDELERQLIGEVAELEGRIHRAEDIIVGLPADHQPVVRLRFCDGLAWDKVSDGSGYSVQHCKRIGRQAITKDETK